MIKINKFRWLIEYSPLGIYSYGEGKGVIKELPIYIYIYIHAYLPHPPLGHDTT